MTQIGKFNKTIMTLKCYREKEWAGTRDEIQ